MASPPILSLDQIAVEIELLNNAIDLEVLKKLVNRWVVEYLPLLESGELDPNVHTVVKAKYMVALKMARIFRRYEQFRRRCRNLYPGILSNRAVFNTTPNSPNDACMSPEGPCTSTIRFGTPTHHSNNRELVARRLNFDRVNAEVPPNRMLTAMSTDPSQMSISTYTLPANYIRPMDEDSVAASSGAGIDNTNRADNNRLDRISSPSITSSTHPDSSSPMGTPVWPNEDNTADSSMSE